MFSKISALILVVQLFCGCAAPLKQPAKQGTLEKNLPLPYARMRGTCLLPEPALLSTVKVPTSIGLSIDVSEQGNATSVIVNGSSGNWAIDEAFVVAGSRCTFHPATIDGKAVPRSQHEIEFRWTPGYEFLGPKRCFHPPHYPKQALLKAESSKVMVGFLIPSDGGDAKIWVKSNPPSRILEAVSVNSVRSCLEFSETRVGLLMDIMYETPFVYMLD